MTHLTSSVPPSNSILTLGGNETSPVEPRLDVFEGPLGGYFSEFAWRVEPSSTVLRHRLGELPGIWPGDFNQNVLVLPTNSWAMIQQSNPTGLPTQPIPTNNPTFVNGTRIVSPPELEQRISEAIKEVLSSRKETIYSPYLSADPNKYLTPKTPVSRRIEQLILEEDGNEELFLDRQQQAKWLKQIMAAHWALHLPQPFIGFDLEEGFFVASCNPTPSATPSQLMLRSTRAGMSRGLSRKLIIHCPTKLTLPRRPLGCACGLPSRQPSHNHSGALLPPGASGQFPRRTSPASVFHPKPHWTRKCPAAISPCR